MKLKNEQSGRASSETKAYNMSERNRLTDEFIEEHGPDAMWDKDNFALIESFGEIQPIVVGEPLQPEVVFCEEYPKVSDSAAHVLPQEILWENIPYDFNAVKRTIDTLIADAQSPEEMDPKFWTHENMDRVVDKLYSVAAVEDKCSVEWAKPKKSATPEPAQQIKYRTRRLPLKSNWLDEYDCKQSLLILRDLALIHFARGGIFGLLCSLLLNQEHYADLLDLKLDYERLIETHTVGQIAAIRQGLALFQKFEPLPLNLDKRDEAIKTFMKTEIACAQTNVLLRASNQSHPMYRTVSLTPETVLLLERARKLIARVLKGCPSVASLKMHFGPGATVATNKKNATPSNKFAEGFNCSAGLVASGLLSQVLETAPHWLDCHKELVSSDPATGFPIVSGIVDSDIDEDSISYVQVTICSGKLVCVPKSAKTYRTIMTEPNLQGYLQQGIRHALERRMEKAGLSTRDQSINAEYARIGSANGLYATIDLSSASDLISYGLVKRLLPESWFNLLSAGRTGSVEVDGKLLNLEKFSSMGNAYTFPLETLIFWAICRAASPHEGVVSVYGDDIIVDSCNFQTTVRALQLAGFVVNTDKSFYQGPFRESCGHDYCNGINIRPYYQKHLVSGLTLFTARNFFYRAGDLESCLYLEQFIHPDLKLWGPDGYGDGHLVLSDWVGKILPKDKKRGYEGVRFDTYAMIPVTQITRYPGDWVSPLYSVYISDRGDCTSWYPVGEPPGVTKKAPDGRPCWSVPGSNGYKRVSIYKLGA